MTHTGRIEDDGDFSDFYPQLPDHMDEKQKRFIQETADEVCIPCSFALWGGGDNKPTIVLNASKKIFKTYITILDYFLIFQEFSSIPQLCLNRAFFHSFCHDGRFCMALLSVQDVIFFKYKETCLKGKIHTCL